MDLNQIINASLAVLTACYVVLTFFIVLQTRRSLAFTKQQIANNKIQSDQASAASEKQSKEAIATIHEQILASERQSKEASDAVHEQIIASEK